MIDNLGDVSQGGVLKQRVPLASQWMSPISPSIVKVLFNEVLFNEVLFNVIQLALCLSQTLDNDVHNTYGCSCFLTRLSQRTPQKPQGPVRSTGRRSKTESIRAAMPGPDLFCLATHNVTTDENDYDFMLDITNVFVHSHSYRIHTFAPSGMNIHGLLRLS